MPTVCRNKWRSGWTRATWRPEWTHLRVHAAAFVIKSWRIWFSLSQSSVRFWCTYLCSQSSIISCNNIRTSGVLSVSIWQKSRETLHSHTRGEADKHIYTYRRINLSCISLDCGENLDHEQKMHPHRRKTFTLHSGSSQSFKYSIYLLRCNCANHWASNTASCVCLPLSENGFLPLPGCIQKGVWWQSISGVTLHLDYTVNHWSKEVHLNAQEANQTKKSVFWFFTFIRAVFLSSASADRCSEVENTFG